MMTRIIVLIILIGCNAFFAAGEIAIITFNDNKMKKLAQEGDKRARILLKLTENSSSFLATIQVGVTLSGFLASAVAAESFAARIVEAFAEADITYSFIGPVALVAVTMALSFISLVFGELVPKRIAMQKAEKISFAVSLPLYLIAKAAKPFIWLLTLVTNGLLRLFGVDPNENNVNVTEEEIRMLVDAGEEKGVIEEDEKDMINNIFEFNDTTVDEIMTHRTELLSLDISMTVREALATALENGYSRIPVYEEDIDTVKGILYVKDLLQYVGRSIPREITLKEVLRKAYFVPEGKPCSDLFDEFKEKKLQMAIVVDEYGGTSGVITMEDLLESIVGNIQDEYDNEEEEITEVSETEFYIDGATLLSDVCDMLEVALPEGDYDTLAGLLVSELGRIPEEDEQVDLTINDVQFTVCEMEDNRIAKIKAVKQPEEEPATE